MQLRVVQHTIPASTDYQISRILTLREQEPNTVETHFQAGECLVCCRQGHDLEACK